MQCTAEIAGFGLTAIKILGESTQHQNNFNGIEFSRAGVFHRFISKLHTSIETS